MVGRGLAVSLGLRASPQKVCRSHKELGVMRETEMLEEMSYSRKRGIEVTGKIPLWFGDTKL